MWRTLLACMRKNPCADGRAGVDTSARMTFSMGPGRFRSDVTTTSMLAPLAVGLLVGLLLASSSASPVRAQDWGSDPQDDWSTPAQYEPVSTLTGWSLRAGVGFTAGPDMFLMNFEAPYAFDRWISAGPMLQVGLKSDESIVAPAPAALPE